MVLRKIGVRMITKTASFQGLFDFTMLAIVRTTEFCRHHKFLNHHLSENIDHNNQPSSDDWLDGEHETTDKSNRSQSSWISPKGLSFGTIMPEFHLLYECAFPETLYLFTYHRTIFHCHGDRLGKSTSIHYQLICYGDFSWIITIYCNLTPSDAFPLRIFVYIILNTVNHIFCKFIGLICI